MFVASFRYGQAALVSVKVLRETKKRFYIDKTRIRILGRNWIWGTYVKKSDHVFTSAADALDYLIQCAETDLEGKKRAVSSAEIHLATLVNLRQAEEEECNESS